MTVTLQSPSLINDFADFLGTEPSREEIVRWRPSAAVGRRYEKLVAKRRANELSADEALELEAFLNSEIILTMLKSRLRSSIEPKS